MGAKRHPRSWTDAVVALIDRLPGPAWLAYAVLVLLSVATMVLVRVIDGSRLDALAIMFGGLTFTPFAVIHYINRAASRALEDYRPALGDLEPEYAEIERRLTSTSVWTGLVGAVVGIAIAVAGITTAGGGWGVTSENSLATNVVTLVFTAVFNASLAVFMLHALGQVVTIHRTHRDSTNIQLWDLPPQNAFARVTALAAILLTIPYGTAALISALLTANSAVAAVLVAVLLAFAVALFACPLVSMRIRLVREKERQLGETDRAFEVAATRLRRAVDAGELSGAADLQNAMSALGIERERLRRVSTWPWTADTLRALLTSLGLPVLLWFLTTVLGRVLFS